ncbi:MAG: hypothetical protein ACR2RB_11995, partial [Gammaproteobacteria bacterium]
LESWVKYCGTAGKPGGQQRIQSSPYNFGSARPTRNFTRHFLKEWNTGRISEKKMRCGIKDQASAVIVVRYAG